MERVCEKLLAVRDGGGREVAGQGLLDGSDLHPVGRTNRGDEQRLCSTSAARSNGVLWRLPRATMCPGGRADGQHSNSRGTTYNSV